MTLHSNEGALWSSDPVSGSICSQNIVQKGVISLMLVSAMATVNEVLLRKKRQAMVTVEEALVVRKPQAMVTEVLLQRKLQAMEVVKEVLLVKKPQAMVGKERRVQEAREVVQTMEYSQGI